MADGVVRAVHSFAELALVEGVTDERPWRAADVDERRRCVARPGKVEPVLDGVARFGGAVCGDEDPFHDLSVAAPTGYGIRTGARLNYGKPAAGLRGRADGTRAAPRQTRGTAKRRLEMQALVYHGPGDKAWETVPDPTIEAATDVIVKITSSTICGTDLHILKGDVPEVKPGTILGHEAVGVITEKGSAVTTLEVGDRVLLSCITSCGRCRFCKEGHYGLCTGGGGWIFGHLIDGLQAEYARVPFAETSVYKVPDELSDEQVLFLADILPTAFEVGVLNGGIEPGDTVAIVGAGPIGLATVMTAKLFTPSHIIAIDLDDGRLESAREFGADITINNTGDIALAKVMELTDGLGADVAIEAVGVPATFELCTQLIRPGGRVANVGVHGHSVTLHLETLWIRDVTIKTGLVDTFSTAKLLKLIADGKLDATAFATHRFPLSETMSAYDTFGDAAATHALKVVLEAEPVAHQPLPHEKELVGSGV